MVTKDLQTLNIKFDQVMFNSLVLTWERNSEVTFGILSVLVFQINVLESYWWPAGYRGTPKIFLITGKILHELSAFFCCFQQTFYCLIRHNRPYNNKRVSGLAPTSGSFCCSTCLLKVVVDLCSVFVISGKDFSVLGEFLSSLILMLYKQTFLIINFALQLTECDLSPALTSSGPLGERKMF